MLINEKIYLGTNPNKKHGPLFSRSGKTGLTHQVG